LIVFAFDECLAQFCDLICDYSSLGPIAVVV